MWPDWSVSGEKAGVVLGAWGPRMPVNRHDTPDPLANQWSIGVQVLASQIRLPAQVPSLVRYQVLCSVAACHRSRFLCLAFNAVWLAKMPTSHSGLTGLECWTDVSTPTAPLPIAQPLQYPVPKGMLPRSDSTSCAGNRAAYGRQAAFSVPHRAPTVWRLRGDAPCGMPNVNAYR